MRLRFHAIAFLLLCVATYAGAKELTAWEFYNTRLQARCPSRHVDYVYIDGYLDLIEAFEGTIPASQRREAIRLADTERQCASEKMGFNCEMARSLEAFRQMNLRERFVEFNCHHVRCEEAALCSEMPKVR